MAEQSGFQVAGGAAELYERYAVRYILGPWAPGLVAAASLQPGERVLDLACGTGVVTRLAASKVGEAGRVTGLDINVAMLTAARALPPPTGASIAWVEGSATTMSLPDASFDVVLCQQGLQFFPDKPAALREIYRVLVPGGRALLSVWKATNPYHLAVGHALERHVGSETATRFCSTRVGLPDENSLRRMLTEAGFQDVQIRSSAMVLQMPPIEELVLGHLSGTPVARAVAALDDERRAALAEQVKTELQPYANADGVAVPDEANIVIAHKMMGIPDGFTIRAAEPGDAAVIADLIRLAFSRQPRPTNPPSSALRETAATIVDHLGRGGGAVLETEGTIVGVVLWNEEEGAFYISRLSVHPDRRREGMARALMAEAERAARRQAFSRMTLGVRLELEENRRFFRSVGFVDASFRSHEGFSEPTWVLMERSLDPATG